MKELYFILGISFACLIYFIYKKITAHVAKKNERKKKEEEMKKIFEEEEEFFLEETERENLYFIMVPTEGSSMFISRSIERFVEETGALPVSLN